MTAGPARFAHVALPLPLATPYTYRIPETLADRAAPGARAVVPVRARELVGVITAVDVDPPGVAARDILGIPDVEPAVTPALMETATWMAGYYGAPIGLALKSVLPAGLWGASQVVVTAVAEGAATGGLAGQLLELLERKGGEAPVSALARAMKRPVWDAVDRLVRVGAVTVRVEPPDTGPPPATERVLVLTTEPLTLLEREKTFGRAVKQRRAYELTEQLGGQAALTLLRERLDVGDSVLKALVTRGLARVEEREVIRDPFAGEPASPPTGELTADQAQAVAQLEALPPGGGALLLGVTGSGKTRVYLEVIRRALEHGRGAIVLVPEIALTPQTVGRVRGMFGDEVAVLHSGLSDGERADAWRLLRRGERRVAVGARSAIFAPIASPGVIVVDEEHEATYKNGESPRYHARDVAAVRARLEGARLILGSATPSVETMTLARDGVDIPVPPRRRLALIRLPERVGALPLPPVELVDLTTAPRVAEVGAIPWSERLDHLVSAALDRQEQVLLLLNRRGFAAFVQCPSCKAVVQCPNCSISLTVHAVPPAMLCHYCNHSERLVRQCKVCGHATQQLRGVGTQQLERMLGERFPGARVARMDLDTTSTKWSHHRILTAVSRGEVDILLGTQMIAKGLDFPNVTLVGVVDADVSLHLPDFRAAERTFQLLAQVAGRAGRGPRGGRVLVQTRSPTHYALVRAAAHDAEGFYEDELRLRRFPPYPPWVALANIVISGQDDLDTSLEAVHMTDWLVRLIARHHLPVLVLGPARAAVARLKDQWRWHVLLKGESSALGRVVRYAARRMPRPSGMRVGIDRDPVHLM